MNNLNLSSMSLLIPCCLAIMRPFILLISLSENKITHNNVKIISFPADGTVVKGVCPFKEIVQIQTRAVALG